MHVHVGVGLSGDKQAQEAWEVSSGSGMILVWVFYPP